MHETSMPSTFENFIGIIKATRELNQKLEPSVYGFPDQLMEQSERAYAAAIISWYISEKQDLDSEAALVSGLSHVLPPYSGLNDPYQPSRLVSQIYNEGEEEFDDDWLKDPTFVALIELIDQFRNVKRVVVVSEDGKIENDVEHSYQVAVCSWLIAKSIGQEIDLEKVLLFSLVHDVPEIGKGDVSSIAASKERLIQREHDEAETIELLRVKFALFPSLVRMIEDYNTRDSIEAEIVYFVDKVLPVINVRLSGHDYYKQAGITIQIWMEKQWKRVQSLKNYELFDKVLGKHVLEFVESNKTDLFVA